MENDKKPYPCTKCGLCCKRAKQALENVKKYGALGHPAPPEALNFPYKFDESGACEKLLPSGLCSVYDNRPLLCNIEKFAAAINVPRQTFFRINSMGCNSLIQQAGLDPSYRVVVE